MEELLECGRIVTTHGVRGAVKVEPWCDGATVLEKLPVLYLPTANGDFSAHPVKSAFVSGHNAVLTLEGIEDMDTALALKGKILYARKSDIPVPDGAMLRCDMIGLPVTDATTGKVYGTLARVDDAPASALYVVATSKGDVLLPAVPAFIKEVSPENGVLVTPIPGFFDDI